jgi:hypothetical protein
MHHDIVTSEDSVQEKSVIKAKVVEFPILVDSKESGKKVTLKI